MGEYDLLPCPFCGGKARLRKRQMKFCGYRDNSSCGGGKNEHVVDYGFQVICNKCKARGPLFIRGGWTSEEICSGRSVPSEIKQAVDAWNARQNDEVHYHWANHYCKECSHYMGLGDFNLCCKVHPGLVYENTEACKDFKEKW